MCNRQLPTQDVQDGGEAGQLTTQLTDLAVTEQEKPREQSSSFSTSMVGAQGESNCQNKN